LIFGEDRVHVAFSNDLRPLREAVRVELWHLITSEMAS
jgi:hypothetical protein